MDSARKNSCNPAGKSDRKGRDSQCVLIGEEKQCFQDPAT